MKKVLLFTWLLMASVFGKSFAQSSCPPITNLRVSNITNTNATFDWDAGPFTWNNAYDFYAVEYKPSNTSVWIWFGGGTPTHQEIGVFSPGTTYDVRVTGQYTYSYGICTPSAVLTFTTTGSAPPPVPYCTAKGSSTTYGWIKSVSFGTINKVSGNNNGYANFTTLSTSVAGNTVIPLTVQAGAKRTPRTQYWNVYVDLNNDGDFFDAGENVSYFATVAGEISTQNIIIPNASLGNHRMRIKMAYYLYGAGGPCGTFNYGEVEDYTLNVTGGSASPNVAAVNTPKNISEEKITTGQLTLYPNPAIDILNVNYPGGEASDLQVFDMAGRIVLEQNEFAGNKKLNISQLNKGMYILSLKSKTGIKTQKFIKE